MTLESLESCRICLCRPAVQCRAHRPFLHARRLHRAGCSRQRLGLLHLLPEEGQDDVHPVHSVAGCHRFPHLPYRHPLHPGHRDAQVSGMWGVFRGGIGGLSWWNVGVFRGGM